MLNNSTAMAAQMHLEVIMAEDKIVSVSVLSKVLSLHAHAHKFGILRKRKKATDRRSSTRKRATES